MLDLIPKLKILVFGDVMLDVYERYYTKDSKPIDSEKGGKKAYKLFSTNRQLGGAANVANNLAKLGVLTKLVGVVGADKYYEIEQLLSENFIIPNILYDESRITTVKRRIYIDDEYLMRIDSEDITKYNMNNYYMTTDFLDAVILSDYDKGFFNEKLAQNIIQTCKKNNIPVIVDPKPQNIHYFKGADIICPNMEEYKSLGEEDLKDSEVTIVITDGENGMKSIDRYYTVNSIDANKVNVVDSVGCGDTVVAGLAIGAALKLSIFDSMKLANDMASLVIQKEGTSTITLQELRIFSGEK